MCSYPKMLPGALGRYLLNVSGWTPNLKKQSGLMVTMEASECPGLMVADTLENSMSKGRSESSNEAFSASFQAVFSRLQIVLVGLVCDALAKHLHL